MIINKIMPLRRRYEIKAILCAVYETQETKSKDPPGRIDLL